MANPMIRTGDVVFVTHLPLDADPAAWPAAARLIKAAMVVAGGLAVWAAALSLIL